jgi:hypothetical protein
MNNPSASSAEHQLHLLFQQMQTNSTSFEISQFSSQLQKVKTLPDYPLGLFTLFLNDQCTGPFESFVVSLLKDLLLDLKMTFPNSKPSNF